MRSTLADAPLVVSTDGTAGPYITVTTDQLGPVVEALKAQGIPNQVDDDAVMIDGRPALAVIDLGQDADVERVQTILDQLTAESRGVRPEPGLPPASHNELILKFPPSVASVLVRRIEATPPLGWKRRTEIEARMRKSAPPERTLTASRRMLNLPQEKSLSGSNLGGQANSSSQRSSRFNHEDH